MASPIQKYGALFIPAGEKSGRQTQVPALSQSPDIVDLFVGVADELESGHAGETPRLAAGSIYEDKKHQHYC